MSYAFFVSDEMMAYEPNYIECSLSFNLSYTNNILASGLYERTQEKHNRRATYAGPSGMLMYFAGVRRSNTVFNWMVGKKTKFDKEKRKEEEKKGTQRKEKEIFTGFLVSLDKKECPELTENWAAVQDDSAEWRPVD